MLSSLSEVAVAQNLQGRLGLNSAPEVSLRDGPANTLTGEFGGWRVVLPGYDLGGVRPEEVVIELAPFDVDVPGSLTSGRMLFRQPPSGMLRAGLSEGEVGRIAASEVAGFPVRGVDLEEGLTLARTEVNVLGQAVPVSVEGGVGAQNNALNFEPRSVEAAGVTVPGRLTRELLQGISFVYPIVGLPAGVQITGAEAERDRLVLTGKVTGLP